jgi:ATP adenylyltransferase
MKQLYAPWRRLYAYDAEKKKDVPLIECVFCHFAAHAEEDGKNFVLKRYEYSFVLLNLYPYNGGHLLIVPYQHTDTLFKLDSRERAELMEVSSGAMLILNNVLSPHGFNMGINIGGKAAGGSIPEHLHMHLLPRWHGDTSFLPTLADTKPISENLLLLYTELKKFF